MDSSDHITFFVDRKEVVLNSKPASQINADKTAVEELAAIEVDVSTYAGGEGQSSGSLEEHLKTGKFERSEVSVEIQGLRETTLSTSETVVNSRVRTVYSRSLSGSTSSIEFENAEPSGDSQQETEHPVFGENAYLDGEQRERKISDSYYISQTYQINAEDKAHASQTTVKCVNFKSSKDFEVGSPEHAGEEAGVCFVDRVEEIIAGQNPEAMGSPKEKHVRFLWFYSEQDDIEAQKRMQSARESVQQLIESNNMVSDIIDVVNDNYMGPESNQIKPPASDNFPAEGGSELLTEPGRGDTGMLQGMASVETKDLHLLAKSGSSTTQVTYTQTGSAGDTTHMTRYKSLASSEVTSSLNTSYSRAGDFHQVTAAFVEKPTNFPTEFEPVDSLITERGSPLALAYSPGMAIRNYALEELEEKRYRVTPERSNADAKSLRFDEESSGVDVDKGSSVDDLGSVTVQSRSELNITSAESYSTDSLSSQRFAVQTGKSLVQEMSREEEDESLDRLVDLESIQVGYRFHDVGIMQEYGGICNPAFDDSDEQETANSSEDRTSSLQSQVTGNIGMLVETSSSGTSEVLSRSQKVTDKDDVTSAAGGSSDVLSRSQLGKDNGSVTSDDRGNTSFVEFATSFIAESAGSSTISQSTSSQSSSILQSSSSVTSSFTTEGITRTSEFSTQEVTTNSTSYSTALDKTRTTFQTKTSEQRGDDHLNTAVAAGEQIEQEAGDSVDDTDFVKELESVIEAGEKAIQKIAESLEISNFQKGKDQDILREAEDWSNRIEPESTQSLQVEGYHSTSVEGRSDVHLYPASESAVQRKPGESGEEAEDWTRRKEAESIQSLQAGGYKSGYTSVEGRIDVHLNQHNQSVLKGKTGESGEDAEDWSRRKEAEATQSLQAGGYKSGYTSVEGRSDVHLYPASESALEGKAVDHSGEETETIAVGIAVASAVGGDVHNEESVEKTRLINETEGYGDSAQSGGHRETETTGRIIRGENTDHTAVTNSTAFAMESASTLYRQEIQRTQVITNKQTMEVSGTGRASYINEVNKDLDMSDSRAGLLKADNETITTDNKDTTKVIKIDNLGSSNKYDISVSTRREDSAVNTKENQFAAKVVETEDINKVLKAVNDSLAGDSAVCISDVNSREQQAVETHSANDVSVQDGQNKDSVNLSGALHEPDQRAQLDKIGSEFVERVIQPTVATDQVNTQSNVGLAVGGGECLRKDTVNIKETSKRKKASRSKGKSRNEDASKSKGTSQKEEASRNKETSRIEEASISKGTTRIEETSISEETSRIEEASRFKETSRGGKSSKSKRTLRNEEASKSKGTSRIEAVLMSKETSRIEEASNILEISSSELSRSKETSRIENASKSKGTSRNEEASRNKDISSIEESSRSKKTSRIKEARSNETSQIEESPRSNETAIIEDSARSMETSRIEEASKSKESSNIEALRFKETTGIEEAGSNETTGIEESPRSKETPKIEEATRPKKTSKPEKVPLSKETSMIEETSRIKETPIQKAVTLQTNKHKQPSYVTRKFNVNKRFEAALKAQGAVLKSESISIAIYYDTAEFTLTLSDCWIRSVNSKWQFHSSFTKLLNELTKHEYSETENKEAILSSLAGLLKCPVPTGADSSVALFVQRSGLREFVRYTTEQKTYSWRGLTIQLDLPEYGFWVGSVTVPASGRAELHEAVGIIDSLWRCTGPNNAWCVWFNPQNFSMFF